MFYLSDLIGKPILGAQGNRVARIRDVVVVIPEGNDPEADDFDEQSMPVVKGFIARVRRSHKPFYLPVEQVKSLDARHAVLATSTVDLTPFERRGSEVVLTEDLWDKQIVDLASRKVVRVNDICMADLPSGAGGASAGWRVEGVDVGIGGFLRRLRLVKLAQSITGKTVASKTVDWKDVEVFGSNAPNEVPLSHRKIAKLHPVDIARITDAVSYHQGAEIIAALDDTLAADTLEEITADRQIDIIEEMSPERAADIIEEMSPDEATDLLSDLSEEQAGVLLDEMDEEEAAEVRQLMRYPENTAGGIMTTEFVRATRDMTVAEVIETNKPVFMSADLIYYIYIVDSENDQNLTGVITVRDLLVNEPDVTVGQIMLTNYISVRPGENEKEVARKMAEYNLLALPVVDRNGAMLGVVTVDDALDALLPEGWQKRLPRIFS